MRGRMEIRANPDEAQVAKIRFYRRMVVLGLCCIFTVMMVMSIVATLTLPETPIDVNGTASMDAVRDGRERRERRVGARILPLPNMSAVQTGIHKFFNGIGDAENACSILGYEPPRFWKRMPRPKHPEDHSLKEKQSGEYWGILSDDNLWQVHFSNPAPSPDPSSTPPP